MSGQIGPVPRFVSAVLGVFCGAVAAVCAILVVASRDPRIALVGVAGAIGAYTFLHAALTGKQPHSTVVWPKRLS